MLVLDSDVFLIDRRYQRDAKYPVKRRFLDELSARGVDRATTIFNLLEVCGVLTFNLNDAQLRTFYSGFTQRYGVHVLGPQLPWRAGHAAIDLVAGRTPGVIFRRVSFGDALMIVAAESEARARTLVTWNASHFIGKTRLAAITPEQWLRREGIVP